MSRVGHPQYEQITFKNSSGESAPAYAVLQVSGAADESDGRTSVTITKPDGTGDLYYPNRQFAVADTKYGKCMNTYPAWVSCSGGTPAAGEQWGPVSGSWSIQNTGSGFIIVGGYDATESIVLVDRVSSSFRIIEFTITSANCSAGTAVVDVDEVNCGGSKPANGQTVNDDLGCFLVEPNANLVNRKGYAVEMKDGSSCKWSIIALCCEADSC